MPAMHQGQTGVNQTIMLSAFIPKGHALCPGAFGHPNKNDPNPFCTAQGPPCTSTSPKTPTLSLFRPRSLDVASTVALTLACRCPTEQESTICLMPGTVYLLLVLHPAIYLVVHGRGIPPSQNSTNQGRRSGHLCCSLACKRLCSCVSKHCESKLFGS